MFSTNFFYRHEYASGYYRVFAYFLAKLFADLLPIRTIGPIVFCSVTYWMVGELLGCMKLSLLSQLFFYRFEIWCCSFSHFPTFWCSNLLCSRRYYSIFLSICLNFYSCKQLYQFGFCLFNSKFITKSLSSNWFLYFRFQLFSGLLLNIESVLPWLQWVQYLSLANYGLSVRLFTF